MKYKYILHVNGKGYHDFLFRYTHVDGKHFGGVEIYNSREGCFVKAKELRIRAEKKYDKYHRNLTKLEVFEFITYGKV